mgnify:FL=1
MKQLLNTLYITNPDRYLSLDGETVVIQNHDEIIGRIPLHNIDSIVTFGYTGASPALMGACAKRNISLSFMTHYGKFLARATGEINGNVTLRKEQYRISDDEKRSTNIAKSFITGKLYNSKSVINRAVRDYPNRVDILKLSEKSELLNNSLLQISQAESAEQLRGIEGESAAIYFSVFDDLILQQKDDFYFHGRNRRPPLDNVNAMLSFSYSLLASMCASALECVGLDPYVGFLHTDRPGRVSLALDLMEELRAIFADRFVLTMINKKKINEKGFIKKENGAVLMEDETRKNFLSEWQNKKQEIIKHPFLEEKVEWGMLPYVQALLLARFIRGDLDAYPPFLWK